MILYTKIIGPGKVKNFKQDKAFLNKLTARLAWETPSDINDNVLNYNYTVRIQRDRLLACRDDETFPIGKWKSKTGDQGAD